MAYIIMHIPSNDNGAGGEDSRLSRISKETGQAVRQGAAAAARHAEEQGTRARDENNPDSKKNLAPDFFDA